MNACQMILPKRIQGTTPVNISRNFTFAELLVTSQKIDNSTSDETVIWNLQLLAENILEAVRFGKGSVIIHSAYRSPKVNAAVGGSLKSQHSKGQAADFHVNGVTNYDLAIWIRDNLDFDQLILENYVKGSPLSGWVHCSFTERNLRYQALTKFKGSKIYHAGILE